MAVNTVWVSKGSSLLHMSDSFVTFLECLLTKFDYPRDVLLFQGIGTYGFGNWAEIARCVGTKSKSECIDHYNAFYMNSPCFPLPVRMCVKVAIDIYALTSILCYSNCSFASRICLVLWERAERSSLPWPKSMVM